MAVVSVQEKTKNIEDILLYYSMDDLQDPEEVSQNTKIFINGNWVGLHENP